MTKERAYDIAEHVIRHGQAIERPFYHDAITSRNAAYTTSSGIVRVGRSLEVIEYPDGSYYLEWGSRGRRRRSLSGRWPLLLTHGHPAAGQAAAQLLLTEPRLRQILSDHHRLLSFTPHWSWHIHREKYYPPIKATLMAAWTRFEEIMGRPVSTIVEETSVQSVMIDLSTFLDVTPDVLGIQKAWPYQWYTNSLAPGERRELLEETMPSLE